MEWEINFLKYIIENIHNDTMTFIMNIITTSGDKGAIWILITAIFLIIPKMRNTGFTMATSLLIMFIVVNVIIKPMVNRVRPFDADIEILNNMLINMPKDGSFPSGHTAASFAAATACFCCNKKWGVILLAWAILMGISRIYFAVHFPTDVIAGLIIGLVIGILSYKICKKKKKIVDKTL